MFLIRFYILGKKKKRETSTCAITTDRKVVRMYCSIANNWIKLFVNTTFTNCIDSFGVSIQTIRSQNSRTNTRVFVFLDLYVKLLTHIHTYIDIPLRYVTYIHIYFLTTYILPLHMSPCKM